MTLQWEEFCVRGNFTSNSCDVVIIFLVQSISSAPWYFRFRCYRTSRITLLCLNSATPSPRGTPTILFLIHQWMRYTNKSKLWSFLAIYYRWQIVILLIVLFHQIEFCCFCLFYSIPQGFKRLGSEIHNFLRQGNDFTFKKTFWSKNSLIQCILLYL